MAQAHQVQLEADILTLSAQTLVSTASICQRSAAYCPVTQTSLLKLLLEVKQHFKLFGQYTLLSAITPSAYMPSIRRSRERAKDFSTNQILKDKGICNDAVSALDLKYQTTSFQSI